MFSSCSCRSIVSDVNALIKKEKKEKNTASIFLEILFFQYFTVLCCKQYDIITALICIKEKRQYL